MLRSTIVRHLDEYHDPTSTREKRKTMVTEILDNIRFRGGRFLKYDDRQDEWYNAGYKAARSKITHSFRDASIPNKVKCMDELRNTKQGYHMSTNLYGHYEAELLSEPLSVHRAASLTFVSRCQQEGSRPETTQTSQPARVSFLADECHDMEPIRLTTASPRVSMTFASFGGANERESSQHGFPQLNDFLEDLEVEMFRELLLEDNE